jgi:hypothetical protein
MLIEEILKGGSAVNNFAELIHSHFFGLVFFFFFFKRTSIEFDF